MNRLLGCLCGAEGLLVEGSRAHFNFTSCGSSSFPNSVAAAEEEGKGKE